MPRVFLSLGSNIDPERHLRLGVRELKSRFGALTLSPVYRNKAVGFEGDDFLNLVVGLDTEESVDQIVRDIEAIHARAGRRRGEEKFSPRTLDIDLLTWGDTVSPGPPARLPRKDILEYPFVLKPLADIAPAHCHPMTGRSYADHWADMAEEEAGLHVVDIGL